MIGFAGRGCRNSLASGDRQVLGWPTDLSLFAGTRNNKGRPRKYWTRTKMRIEGNKDR